MEYLFLTSITAVVIYAIISIETKLKLSRNEQLERLEKLKQRILEIADRNESEDDVKTDESEEDDDVPELVPLKRPYRKYPLNRKIIDLRWNVITDKIVTLDEAIRILSIRQNTPAFDKIRDVHSSSLSCHHILDHFNDQEFIVFRHPYRNFLAVYTAIPFFDDPFMSFNLLTEAEFWKRYDLDQLLEERYRKYVAARRIQKSEYMTRWLQMPITKDGQCGITCRLGWKNMQDSITNNLEAPIQT